MADAQVNSAVGNTAQGMLKDIENLLGQRLGRLREELADELGKAAAAGGSLGGGLGLAALGTILGGIGFVHLLHRATGLPLWLCYAGSSAVACTLASGLVAEGVRKVGDLDVLPEGTADFAGDVAQHAAEHAGVAGG
jgi:hypothetical protein